MIEELGNAGALRGIRWAHSSAVASVMALHDEGVGYTNITYANALYDLTIDRKDRVFQTGRHEAAPEHPDAGEDILRQGLSPDVPWEGALQVGTVRRDDLRGSEGWRCGRWRWLRQSFAFGDVYAIKWSELGETKQRVAAARPDLDSAGLFSLEEFGFEPNSEVADTLIVAQSIDATTGDSELYLGRARLADDGGPAWHWLHNLLDAGPEGRPLNEGAPVLPTGPAPRQDVDDAPVRLRPSAPSRENRASDQG